MVLKGLVKVCAAYGSERGGYAAEGSCVGGRGEEEAKYEATAPSSSLLCWWVPMAAIVVVPLLMTFCGFQELN